jgi:transcriptional regulator with XRE-family HTH domain
MDAKIFWDNVEPLRKAKNLTQEELSNIIKVPFRTFQGWLSKGILPDVEQAAGIAQALNTTVEYLVSGSEPGKPDMEPLIAHAQALLDGLKKL